MRVRKEKSQGCGKVEVSYFHIPHYEKGGKQESHCLIEKVKVQKFIFWNSQVSEFRIPHYGKGVEELLVQKANDRRTVVEVEK